MGNGFTPCEARGTLIDHTRAMLARTGPDSEIARMDTLVSLSPNVKRTVLCT